MTAQVAAAAAALLLAGVSLFQLALALGAPLGSLAWGGRSPGVLPVRLRVGSALSAIWLLAMCAIVLIRGKLLQPEWHGAMTAAVWMIFLFMMLNTFANLKSESAGERTMMAPLTAVIAVLLGVLQLTIS